MAFTDGKIDQRDGSYRFVSENQIELTTSDGRKWCTLNVLFDKDNDYEVTLTLPSERGFNAPSVGYHGKFYRTGTLVLRTNAPIALGVRVWIEAGGKRIDWKSGTQQVKTEIPAGKRRVTVLSSALQLPVFDEEVHIKPDTETILDIGMGKGVGGKDDKREREEKEAKKLLDQALQVLNNRGIDKPVREKRFRDLLQEIIKKYPDTPSAKKAQQQLEKMKE
jgi:hypothetical protein